MIEPFDIPKILKKALKNGGDFAELYADDTESLQIIAEQKKIEKVSPSIDRGVGLRVMWGEQTAYGFTNDVSEKSLLELADSVAGAVKAKTFDKDIVLKAVPPHVQFEIRKPPRELAVDKKRDLIARGEKAAWAADPSPVSKVKQVKVLYGEISKRVTIANSLGEIAKDNRTYALYFVQVVAQDPDSGLLQTGYHPVGGLIGLEFLDEPDSTPEAIAKKAAAQALQMLKARKAPAGRMPVVLSSEAGGTMVHEAVGHGLEADLAGEGLSVYHDKIGQKIAGDRITVVDDATLPNKRGSFVFDDEGTPSERSVLIENGVLKKYMSDRKMSAKHGFPLTGNGRRESYRFRPICRMTNTMILPGSDDPASILRSTDSGLFVRKMGGGQVNTVNGDFVFEVNEGYLIDKGKIGDPVRGAILMGNGPKILQIIDKIGNDHGFGIGTCGKSSQGVPVGDAQPTLRIPEIVVGGAS
jgi:TldD protein